jgi:hypothetical protein
MIIDSTFPEAKIFDKGHLDFLLEPWHLGLKKVTKEPTKILNTLIELASEYWDFLERENNSDPFLGSDTFLGNTCRMAGPIRYLLRFDYEFKFGAATIRIYDNLQSLKDEGFKIQQISGPPLNTWYAYCSLVLKLSGQRREERYEKIVDYLQDLRVVDQSSRFNRCSFKLSEYYFDLNWKNWSKTLGASIRTYEYFQSGQIIAKKHWPKRKYIPQIIDV